MSIVKCNKNMSEQGDLDLFTGPAPSEQKEMSDEKFREEMQRTQQAVKQLQKEEGKAKKNDNKLIFLSNLLLMLG